MTKAFFYKHGGVFATKQKPPSYIPSIITYKIARYLSRNHRIVFWKYDFQVSYIIVNLPEGF